MSKFPVGIIGCGNISKVYAAAGKRFENFEVVACADLDVARAEAFAREHGIPKALSPEDLLADQDVALVINLTVPAAHAEVAWRALKKGKHVYTEKPLTLRRREARELIGLAREKQVRLGGAPDTFLGGGLQTCRKLIDEGLIGEPLGGAGFMLSRGPEGWHPNPDFFYKKGAGPLFDVGPYYLAAFTTLLGPVKRVTASARSSFPQRTIGSQPLAGTLINVEVPNHVAAILDFASGPVVTLTTSFDVVGSRVPNIEIYGSEGTLVVPDPNTFGGPIFFLPRGEKEWREMPLQFGYADQSRGLGVADLVASIHSEREHRANERVAYHVLDLMHTIIDASETGRHIDMKSSMSRPDPLPLGLADGQIELP
jgi:predicted dehydrogenase